MAWTRADAERLHERRLRDFDLYRAQVLRIADFEASAASGAIAVLAFVYLAATGFIAWNVSLYLLWGGLLGGGAVFVGALFIIKRRLARWVARRFTEFDALEGDEFTRYADDLASISGEHP